MREKYREVDVVGWQDNTRKNRETIWDHLKSPLSKPYYEPNRYVKVNLLFLDIKDENDVKDISPLEKYCKERGEKISYELRYDVDFKDTEEEEWAKRSRRIFNAIRICVENTDSLTQNAIKKIVVRFWVDSLSERYLDIVTVKDNLNNYEGKKRYDCEVNLSVDIENNLPADWINAYKLSVSCWKNRISSEVKRPNIFKVRFIVNTDNDEVTNLRYFFPINNFFKRNNSSVWLYVKGGDFTRIRQFVSAVNFKEDIIDGNQVLINDYFLGRTYDKLIGRVSSDILPAIVFRKNDNMHTLNVIKVLKNQYKSYMFEIRNYFSENDKRKYDEAERKLKTEKNSSEIDRLNNELKEIEAKYNPTKEELCKILNNKIYVNDSNFTNLIFSFLIRRLLRDKRIFLSESDGLVIDESKIKTAWFNAKTYAEGLLQLIENAQLHSEGHTAYFGMRYYKADQSVSMSKLSEESDTRIKLWERYRRKSTKNSIFNNKEYYDFLEFYVLDDAIDSNGEPKGILDKFGETKDEEDNPINEIKENAIKSIESIFGLSESNYKDGYKENYYTVHYGMRWAQRHFKKLDGIMEIFSPCKMNNAVETQAYSSFAGVSIQKEDVKNLYYTEYSILIPIGDLVKKSSVKINGNSFADINVFGNLHNYPRISLSKEEALSFNLKGKRESVKYLRNILIEKIVNNTLSFIDANTIINNIGEKANVPLFIEKLAKGIFSFVYKRESPLYIAVYFGDNKEYAMEFARIFAVFYDKQGTNNYLKNIQIAICTNSEKDPHRKEVNFILAGDSLASAYRTATNFVYYNSDASLEFVPLLEFYNDGKDGTSTNIFPFDLYLNDNAIRKSGGQEEERNWFLWLMLDRLETELNDEKYGCMVKDIRARIGSKIHLDKFYEAELLFQNSGTVMRFAYLLASDIIKNEYIRKNCINVITGYENYSSVLILEATKLLQDYYKKLGDYDIYWVVDVKNETSDERLPKIKFEGELKRKLLAGGYKQVNCITVIPVNAVMATVYKVHASFKRGVGELLFKNIKDNEKTDKLNPVLKEKMLDRIVTFSANYCLVAVGDTYISGVVDNEFIKNYVTEIENNKDKSIWGEATLAENKVNEEGIKVKYLLPVASEWEKPGEFKINVEDKKRLPLVQVDKTSTLLDTYFQLELNDEAKKYYKYK